MLAVACEDKTVKLLAIPGGNEIKSIGGHTRFILAMTTSPDGQWLASGGADEAVRLTSLPKGEAIASKAGQAGWINALGVSADGRMLAIGGGDRSAKVWSTADWRELHSLVGHRGAVSAVVFSPDGKLLASASHDRTIRLWSLDNGALLQCLADVQAIPVEVKTVRYRIRDHRQEWVTIIVPAGTTVPRGAECVCEAVPGEWKPPPVTVRPGGCDADAGAKAGDADCARKPACWCVSKPACGCDGDCKCQPVYVSCPCVNRPACGCVGHCSCMAVGGGGGGGTIHYWYPN
jgi:WD40 repeat protein